MQLEQVQVLAEGLAFPEGPVAMPDGSVVVAEMMAGRLTRVSGEGHVAVVAHLGGGPNGAALGPGGAVYVCNNGGVLPDNKSAPSIQRVDPETGATEVLYTECDGEKLAAPNDLVFDSIGGFWFTDFRGSGIHYARADGSLIRRIDAPASEPNGIGLSPGEEVLYWAQTTSRQVHRRRLAGPGEIVASMGYTPTAAMLADTLDHWSLLVGLPGASELDSLAIEADGTVCVGTIVDGAVVVIDPGGRVVRVLHAASGAGGSLRHEYLLRRPGPPDRLPHLFQGRATGLVPMAAPGIAVELPAAAGRAHLARSVGPGR